MVKEVLQGGHSSAAAADSGAGLETWQEDTLSIHTQVRQTNEQSFSSKRG